jgi:hypothetical protein
LEHLESRRLFAVTAVFAPGTGVLSVFGDNLNNNITVSRNAAGQLLVNGGAVEHRRRQLHRANTALIQVFGQGGDDTITLNEANGALPKANLFGGAGNDTLTGGSGNDQLFGQAGNDHAPRQGRLRLPLRRHRERRPDRRATPTTRSSASRATTA